MSAQQPKTEATLWIGAWTAARILGVSHARILQMAKASAVSSRQLPGGVPIRFDRAEIEALALSSIRRPRDTK